MLSQVVKTTDQPAAIADQNSPKSSPDRFDAMTPPSLPHRVPPPPLPPPSVASALQEEKRKSVPEMPVSLASLDSVAEKIQATFVTAITRVAETQMQREGSVSATTLLKRAISGMLIKSRTKEGVHLEDGQLLTLENCPENLRPVFQKFMAVDLCVPQMVRDVADAIMQIDTVGDLISPERAEEKACTRLERSEKAWREKILAFTVPEKSRAHAHDERFLFSAARAGNVILKYDLHALFNGHDKPERLEHGSPIVHAVACGGRRAMSVGAKGRAVVHHEGSPFCINDVYGPMSVIQHVALTRDGRRGIIGDCFGSVTVVAFGTNEPLRVFKHEGAVTSVHFSDDGIKALVVTTKGSTVFDFNENAYVQSGARDFHGGIFAPDGTSFVTRERDAVWLNDSSSKSPPRQLRQGTDAFVSYSANSGHVRIVAPDGEVTFRETNFGVTHLKMKIAVEHKITSAAVSPGGKWVVTRIATGDILLHALTEKIATRKLGHTDQPATVSFAPDGSHFVIAEKETGSLMVFCAESEIPVVMNQQATCTVL